MLPSVNRQIVLGRQKSLFLGILLILIFTLYSKTLFSRYLSESYFEKALNYFSESEATDKELVVERARFYRKALKSVQNAINHNPYDARPYFEYAENISKIAQDRALRSSLGPGISNKGAEKDSVDFYGLAKSKYIEAILREPTNALYHQRLGDIYDKLSDAKNAESELRKALLLDPQNLLIHIYVCQYFLSKNKQQNFDWYFNKAMELYAGDGYNYGAFATQMANFLKSIGRQDLIKQ
jgi:tetratricopeptide (TPR) repeat protein